MKMIKINVIFVHGIEFSTFTENLGKSVIGRNLPYPFLSGQPLNNSLLFFNITQTDSMLL